MRDIRKDGREGDKHSCERNKNIERQNSGIRNYFGHFNDRVIITSLNRLKKKDGVLVHLLCGVTLKVRSEGDREI